MKGDPHSGNNFGTLRNLQDSDEHLRKAASQIASKRKRLGHERLVGGLQAIVINTEQEKQQAWLNGNRHSHTPE